MKAPASGTNGSTTRLHARVRAARASVIARAQHAALEGTFVVVTAVAERVLNRAMARSLETGRRAD